MPTLKWIADFRDPWTNIDFYADLNLTFIADKLHHALERKVIQRADVVLVVSNGMKAEFEHLNPKRLEVITNGYDNDDTITEHVKLDQKFSLSHIGTLNAARNPKILWKVLAELCHENEQFKADLIIRLVGKTDFSVFEEIEKNGLIDLVDKIAYLSHAEAIQMQKQSQVLLLLINNSNNAKGILTGKFFEYLAAKRPVLAVGPTDGDVADVLNQSQAGFMVDFDDFAATKHAILTYYQKFQKSALIVNSTSIEKYSRKELTGQLLKVLDSE
jgi:glycosyltransferase involved in cell wall biosynthesis